MNKYLIENGWKINSKDQLTSTFEFADFKGSIAFVRKVAIIAEEQEHHPDILIKYNKVKISCFTHDASKITELDFKLAISITKAYTK